MDLHIEAVKGSEDSVWSGHACSRGLGLNKKYRGYTYRFKNN